MKYYNKALSNYMSFKGRARRREFWHFFLTNFIAYLVLSVIEVELGIAYYLTLTYLAFIFIPTISVTVRRFHDLGKSGKYALLYLLIFVGAVMIMYYTIQEGDEGTNKYGESPKA
ncbi:MAG: DUF805 domain-containing protein [Candidatus Kapaibacterium sp.]